MILKSRLATIMSILLLGMALQAQDNVRKVDHSVSFKSGFLQFKDQFNYGLVNNGLNLFGAYTRISASERNTFIYGAELGFGINYRQGLGMVWSLKPYELFYGFRLNENPAISITLGPYISGYYMWNLYPELQSGHMFWLSSHELGPQILITMPVKDRMLHFSLSSSIASLNSRPEMRKEEYFYSLTFSDFVMNPHTNMTFGSLNVYNHINLNLALSNPNKKFSLSYEFEFSEYLHEPSLKYISHSINMNWKLGNKKTYK